MEQRTNKIITGLFEKRTEAKGQFFVGGRINLESLEQMKSYAEQHGGLENCELVVEENKNPKTEKSPKWFLILKKKFVPKVF